MPCRPIKCLVHFVLSSSKTYYLCIQKENTTWTYLVSARFHLVLVTLSLMFSAKLLLAPKTLYFIVRKTPALLLFDILKRHFRCISQYSFLFYLRTYIYSSRPRLDEYPHVLHLYSLKYYNKVTNKLTSKKNYNHTSPITKTRNIWKMWSNYRT